MIQSYIKHGLEGQSKNYGVSVVIGEETNKIAEPNYATLELDLIAVKGKIEAVQIFALLGNNELRERESFKTLQNQHRNMITAFRSQSWNEARLLVQECRTLDGAFDVLYDLYDERIDHYTENPPGTDWDGVFIATTK